MPPSVSTAQTSPAPPHNAHPPPSVQASQCTEEEELDRIDVPAEEEEEEEREELLEDVPVELWMEILEE